MKKILIILLAIFSVSIPKTFAAFGNARDGDLFAVILIGFLLLVAGILSGIDFLRKNRKQLIEKIIRHKKILQKQENTEPLQPFPDEPKNYFDYSY
jgi:uncharacterized membrane protein HdeD (DUF308 family)